MTLNGLETRPQRLETRDYPSELWHCHYPPLNPSLVC
jgi:hypothetical protein